MDKNILFLFFKWLYTLRKSWTDFTPPPSFSKEYCFVFILLWIQFRCKAQSTFTWNSHVHQQYWHLILKYIFHHQSVVLSVFPLWLQKCKVSISLSVAFAVMLCTIKPTLHKLNMTAFQFIPAEWLHVTQLKAQNTKNLNTALQCKTPTDLYFTGTFTRIKLLWHSAKSIYYSIQQS